MTTADLRKMESLRVSRNTLRQTQAFMRRNGKDDIECIVLWAGKILDLSTFQVTRAIFPVQKGTLVTVNVDEEEIKRIDDETRLRGEVIGAQLHTHPTSAFHSDTDDATPIISKVGALSIVIPYFARDPIETLTDAVAVRLSERGWSRPLTRTALDSLFEVS